MTYRLTDRAPSSQQIGTADPELAVQAALTVERDVAGVDLNCGCPKPFSTHNGAGAGLLTTPDKLIAILTGLVGALSVPVSCKIRLLPDQAETLALVERICQTGIQNLTVHARTKTMRSTERALIERLSDIVEVATRYGIPVAANGDVTGMWDFEKIKKMTGASVPGEGEGVRVGPDRPSSLIALSLSFPILSTRTMDALVRQASRPS